MSIRIEIKVADAKTRSGTSQKTGKPYSMREQEGWAFLMDRDGTPAPYPSRISLSLDDSQPPYPVGVYTLAASSFYMGDYGTLKVRPKLQPLSAPARAAA